MPPLRRLLVPAVLLALFWIALVPITVTSVLVGVPAIALALVAWWQLLQRESNEPTPDRVVYRLNWFALPPFALHFIVRSAVAGVDVARRTLGRTVDIAPGWRRVELTLPPGAPQVLLGATLGLLPGTLSVEFEDDALLMHVLDEHVDLAPELATMERLIGALFRVEAQ